MHGIMGAMPESRGGDANIMKHQVKVWALGLSVFLLGTAARAAAQMNPPQLPNPSVSAPSTGASTASPSKQSQAVPDHAAAYYHYMLARRYEELAGIYNRSDYIERAIAEYQQAIQADPSSLFLKVELAGLLFSIFFPLLPALLRPGLSLGAVLGKNRS